MDSQKVVELPFEYIVELDNSGKVIGGEWLSFIRPDFSWNVEISDFSGYFDIVRTIYLDSIGGNARTTNLGKQNYFFFLNLYFSQ